MDRDIYNVLLEKLKSLEDVMTSIPTLSETVSTLQSSVSDLETATAFSNATLTAASEDVELRDSNYIFKFGKLLVYNVSVRLNGTETTIPANTWKTLFAVPEGFRLKAEVEVPAENTTDAVIAGSGYYSSSTHNVSIRPTSAITGQKAFNFVIVGEVEASA